MIRKIWIVFTAVLFLSGCSHNKEMAQTYTQRYDEEINIDNSGFPVSVSEFLDSLKDYDFYDKLKVVQIRWDEIPDLKQQEYTVYILTDPEPEPDPESEIERTAEYDEEAAVDQTEMYSFDQIRIIYNGSNKQIHRVLAENSR